MFRTPATCPTRCVASDRVYCVYGVVWDDTIASPVRNKARFGRDRRFTEIAVRCPIQHDRTVRHFRDVVATDSRC
eukprot:3343167-Prymnesium_polylepis.2